mmetsp:Transcript_118147/g.329447  ORF Transcript_118147/g.329447 Transcript_118147/m.329447 type:complete len:323 (+) Transcript_118147:277-1245(+)
MVQDLAHGFVAAAEWQKLLRERQQLRGGQLRGPAAPLHGRSLQQRSARGAAIGRGGRKAGQLRGRELREPGDYDLRHVPEEARAVGARRPRALGAGRGQDEPHQLVKRPSLRGQARGDSPVYLAEEALRHDAGPRASCHEVHEGSRGQGLEPALGRQRLAACLEVVALGAVAPEPSHHACRGLRRGAREQRPQRHRCTLECEATRDHGVEGVNGSGRRGSKGLHHRRGRQGLPEGAGSGPGSLADERHESVQGLRRDGLLHLLRGRGAVLRPVQRQVKEPADGRELQGGVLRLEQNRGAPDDGAHGLSLGLRDLAVRTLERC